MVLVTGGSEGIGLATAQLFSLEGCQVIVASRSKKKVDAAAKTIPGCLPFCLDIADEKILRESLTRLVTTRPIDILVMNSGGPPAGMLGALTLDDWDLGYRLIIRSLVVAMECVLPSMRLGRWGRVLSISSTSARQIIGNLPLSGTFRAGLSAWVKHAAKEYGRDGILVNNILPGPTHTARLEHLKETHPTVVETMKKESALGRFAEADEIARVAVFLCSGANTYMTGTDVLVDGGFTNAV